MIQSPVIIALDFNNTADALALVEQLSPEQCRLKVGKEMFTLAGPAFVETLQNKGFEIFLDLKFHDIPNTVAKACEAAAQLGVWMLNVHALGGRRMMTAAAEVLQKFQQRPQLIAVTILTSMDEQDLKEIGIDVPAPVMVEKLAALANESGLDGVVCSAQEAAAIRDANGNDFIRVTPGIRPAGSEQGDQRRILTPSQAMQNGSSYLVIGRPITQAADPMASLAAINQELGV